MSALRAPKKVAIVQSNYIPWKGYFDLIHSVDEFILYDDVQYTKRDWRNRNQIKTAQGLQWLSVPVEVKGNRFQAIKDARISDSRWGDKHWNTLTANYGRAPYFKTYQPELEAFYRNPGTDRLSDINFRLIKFVTHALGIHTQIRFSMDYPFERGEKNAQLISLCECAGATEYFSGPAASVYLSAETFATRGITLRLFDYSGYPQYKQSHPPFEHAVTILDLLFNEGPNATSYMKSFARLTKPIHTQPELAS